MERLMQDAFESSSRSPWAADASGEHCLLLPTRKSISDAAHCRQSSSAPDFPLLWEIRVLPSIQFHFPLLPRFHGAASPGIPPADVDDRVPSHQLRKAPSSTFRAAGLQQARCHPSSSQIQYLMHRKSPVTTPSSWLWPVRRIGMSCAASPS